MKQLVWGLTNKKEKEDIISNGKQYRIMENRLLLTNLFRLK